MTAVASCEDVRRNWPQIGVGAGEAVGVIDGLSVEVGDAVLVAELVADFDSDALDDGVGDKLTELEELALPDVDAEVVGDREPEGEGVAVRESEFDTDAVIDADTDGEGLTEGVGLAESA